MIGKTERNILNILHKTAWMTEERIRKTLKRKSSVHDELNNLIGKGLVGRFKKEKSYRYLLTAKGERLLKEPKTKPKKSYENETDYKCPRCGAQIVLSGYEFICKNPECSYDNTIMEIFNRYAEQNYERIDD